MSDIVEWLRGMSQQRAKAGLSDSDKYSEAADEIVRLRGAPEIDALMADYADVVEEDIRTAALSMRERIKAKFYGLEWILDKIDTVPLIEEPKP